MGGINTLIPFAPAKYERAKGTITLVAAGDSAFSIGKLTLRKQKPSEDDDLQAPLQVAPEASLDSHPAINRLLVNAPASTTPPKDFVVPARWAWLGELQR
jgi:hypothetical protein